jgi:hypothetical protein
MTMSELIVYAVIDRATRLVSTADWEKNKVFFFEFLKYG